MSVAPCVTGSVDKLWIQLRQLRHPGHVAINTFFYSLGLPVSPSVLPLRSFYQSFRSSSLASSLSSKLLISSSSVTDAISPSHSLYLLSLRICIPSFLSQLFTLSISISSSLSLSFFPLFRPSSPRPSLSAQPTASLSLGRGEQCQPTWGPSAVPAEKAGSTAEHP